MGGGGDERGDSQGSPGFWKGPLSRQQPPKVRAGVPVLTPQAALVGRALAGEAGGLSEEVVFKPVFEG